MLEVCIAVVAVLALLALSALPSLWAIAGGVAVMLASFLVGTAAGVVYHRRLFAACGGRPARWWIDPTVHHGDLPRDLRDGVLRSFRVGVAGFAGCMLGVAMVVTGWIKAL